jgi:hypothetical protein
VDTLCVLKHPPAVCTTRAAAVVAYARASMDPIGKWLRACRPALVDVSLAAVVTAVAVVGTAVPRSAIDAALRTVAPRSDAGKSGEAHDWAQSAFLCPIPR